ncbi:MAG TPA: CocE/NonD family hydrolase, partial [Solirubrobacteraceae bacterium]
MLLRAICAAVAVLALGAGTAQAAWKPGKARYGVGKIHNAAITSADGTIIRADVYYPTTGGKAAGGKFPVIVTQTPYGKDDAGTGGTTAQLAGYSEYLVDRGYIQVISDVRGTGGSQG